MAVCTNVSIMYELSCWSQVFGSRRTNYLEHSSPVRRDHSSPQTTPCSGGTRLLEERMPGSCDHRLSSLMTSDDVTSMPDDVTLSSQTSLNWTRIGAEDAVNRETKHLSIGETSEQMMA